MNTPKQIKCELVGIKRRTDNKIGIVITLRELTNNNNYEIIVDESLDRVKQRLTEQYYGDERDGIYLTRGMTNIDINTKGDMWDINQEDWNWYTFSKEDVLSVVNKTEVSIPIDSDKVNEIAKRLLNENVNLKVKVIESKEDIITVIDLNKFDKIKDNHYFGVMTFRDYISLVKSKFNCTDENIINWAELKAIKHNRDKDINDIPGIIISVFISDNDIEILDNAITLMLFNLEERFLDNKLCIRVFTGSLEEAKMLFIALNSQIK